MRRDRRAGRDPATARLARQLLVWFVAAAVAAGGTGLAVSRGLQRVLASTVDAALGEAGRFDVLVQVHQERRREALAALRAFLRERLPGAQAAEGPAAAGTGVLLISLTPAGRGRPAFEALARELPSVPGFVAWIPLVEPSVTVARLHPALEAELDRWLAGRRDVAFSFPHGDERVVVLKEARSLQPFRTELERHLAAYGVVRVVTPGHPPDPALVRRVAEAVETAWRRAEVVYAGPAAEGAAAGAARWVGRMRDFFLTYATLARIEPLPGLQPPLGVGDEVLVGSLRARVVSADGGRWLAVPLDDPAAEMARAGEPQPVRRPSGELVGTGVVDGGRARIEQALRQSEAMLSQLERAGAAGWEALAAAQAVADRMGEAVARAETMVQELARLSSTASDPVRDTVVALGLSLLLGRRAARAPEDAAAYVAELKAKLSALQDQLDALQASEPARIRQRVRELRESLPRFDGVDVSSALQLLEESQWDPLAAPAGVELVLRGDALPTAGAAARAVRGALGLEGVRAYVFPAGIASPSPRAALLRVVERATVAAGLLATAAFVVWSLVNDGSAVSSVLHAARRGRREGPPGAHLKDAAAGAVVGAALAGAAGLMCGGAAEPVGLAALVAVGALAGAAAARFGARLSWVDADAVEAACAVGMDPGAVLAVVAAPALRPWVLSWTAARPPARVEPLLSPASPVGGGPDPAGPVLEACGVVRRWGHQVVLDGVSLSVERGETVVLMGPSGCGKSTLLRCLKGLVQPDEGTVRVHGQDLWALPEPERRALAARVGMVFQRPQLVGHLSVLHNAALAAAWAGVSWEEACERASYWLSVLGMGRYLDRRPPELSGGEGQRVAIARALAARPEVVLWDEPTSHLDPMLAADLLELMEELMASLRTTMLVVTHEPRFTARVGDRLVLMERGRVVEMGPPRRVLEHPRSEVGRRLARLAAV